jgi:hypothetical protein
MPLKDLEMLHCSECAEDNIPDQEEITLPATLSLPCLVPRSAFLALILSSLYI